MPNKPGNNLVSSTIGVTNRPPVIVVMGHIDHGKSSLLDFIRKSNVVAGEAGGITQHVGAYQVVHTSSDGLKHPITFLDTPGHEAFCNIRERGAEAADVAILIVSAEDGVKPQTIEAFNVIKESKIPYVVAITKIDKPNANIEKTKQTLGENEVYVEGWGGDVPCVAISNLTGENIPELLDLVILVAELADLKTDPTKPAEGVVIESELDTRKGISATLLLKTGTLETGSFVVAGNAYSPVRFIEDFKGEKIEIATASMPIVIIGWSAIPACGALFKTVISKKEAERAAGAFEAERRRNAPKIASIPLATKAADKLKRSEIEADAFVTLPVVLKADVIGSLEGAKFELNKIKNAKVEIKIVSEGIGEINENDVKLAQSDPSVVVVGFNAPPEKKAATLIERSPVPLNIGNFSIIYDLAAFVRETMEARIPKEYIEEMTGRAKILAIFNREKDRQVVGGKVETGTIESGNDVRIMRREAEIGRGKIKELQEKKVKTREVAEGHEFGVMIEAKIEIAAGDRVEAVRTVEKKL